MYPGETLIISVWKIENNKYVFEASVKERNTKACVGVIESKADAKL